MNLYFPTPNLWRSTTVSNHGSVHVGLVYRAAVTDNVVKSWRDDAPALDRRRHAR